MSVPVNLMDPAVYGAGVPVDTYAWLRERDPIHWNEPFMRSYDNSAIQPPPQRGFWALTRFADVSHVSRHPELFSSEQGTALMGDVWPHDLWMWRQQLIHMDPPRHTHFRRVLSQGFTPRRIRELHRFIEERCSAIVDELVERGPCDFVDAVAKELPLQVVGELFGMPHGDFPLLTDWTDRIIGIDDPASGGSPNEGLLAVNELFGYVTALGEEKRRSPDGTVVSELVNSTIHLEDEADERPLTPPEINMFFFLLVIAGNETTRNALSGGVLALSDHPDQRRRLVEDPSLLGTATDEIVRYISPVIAFRRTVTADTEISGHALTEGEKVVVFYGAANRDPEVFPDPDRFDVARTPNHHLGFGIGTHYCLGANLARAEISAMFAELMRRVPDIEVSGEPTRWQSTLVNSWKTMPVTFTS
jgi:cytochrome P450